MTPKEINIAIAEATEWNYSERNGRPYWDHGDVGGERVWDADYLPQFCESLDLMHKLESEMTALDHQKFCLFLHKIIMGTMDGFDINGTCNMECISRVVRANSMQRAEAFLRLKNIFVN